MPINIHSKKTTRILFLIIPIVSFFMHYSIFEKELVGVHVWRQSQTEINIQNFYRHDFNIFNPRTNFVNAEGKGSIYRQEFPLMQWLIACVHKVTDDKIIVSRICLFFIGLWSVWGMFNLLNNLFKDNFLSLLGAWAFNFAPVFYYYTMNPIPDNFALCTAIWSLVFFFKYVNFKNRNDLVLSAFFLMLAALTKLPYIIFGAVPGYYFIKKFFTAEKPEKIQALYKGLIFIAFQIPTLIWYEKFTAWNGNGVLTGIFANKITNEKFYEILRYHYNYLFPYLLINIGSTLFFTASFFVLLGQKSFKKEKVLIFIPSVLLVASYFFLEINMIDKVHDYYMMPFLIPLFVMVTAGIRLLYNFSILTRSFTIIFLLSLPNFAYDEVQKYWYLYNEGDMYVHHAALRRAVPKDALCIILNDDSGYVFSYQIDKQGYICDNDNLPASYVEDAIKKSHVTYMYCNTRKVDERPEIKNFFESEVMRVGDIRVFKLKKL